MNGHGSTAPMMVVGLTGGIASGKSTVAARMRELGLPVIDADRVAREVVEPGQPALAEIRRAFGDVVISPEGRLDRPRLGAIVFADADALARLNAITHPRIARRTAELLAELRAAGHRLAVYEAALLVENGRGDHLARLVAVVCDPAEQVRRLVSERGMDPQEARRRVAAQTDNAARRAAADEVIENDGTLAELRGATDRLVRRLEALATGGSPAPSA